MDLCILRAVYAALLSSMLHACLVNGAVQTSLVAVDVEPPGPLTTTKAGGTAVFEMSLSGVALGSAIVELQSSNTSLGQPVPQTFFFAQNAWTIPQQVTMVGKDDGVVGNENYLLAFNLKGTSFLVEYSQSDVVPLQFIAVDDVAAILSTFTWNTDNADVAVRLRCAPTADVTVTLGSAAANTINPSSLTFTPADYATTQPVTVLFNPNSTPLLSLTAASQDANYNGVTTQFQLAAKVRRMELSE